MWGMISWYVLVGAMVLIIVLPAILHYLNGKKQNVLTNNQPVPQHPTNWHYTPEPYDGGKRTVYGFYQCNIRKFYVEYEWQAREILKILNGEKE
jgi:hypothetical protein